SQICPSLTYAIVPRGEICGEWPASTRLGSPPLHATVQTACSVPAGLLVGFGTWPAAFFPSPRTKTTVSESAEKLRSDNSCPSSLLYSVSCLAVNAGPSATQTLRRPP